jgi:hypothetical protein
MLSPSPTNPRKRITQAAIEQLAGSIATHGLAQPILARPQADAPAGEPALEIVAGERRWRACQWLGQQMHPDAPAIVEDGRVTYAIPAIVRELSDQQVLALQLADTGYTVLRHDAAREACAADGRGVKPGWHLLEDPVPAHLGDATLKVVDVVQHHVRPWFRGPYGFVLHDARPMPFVPVRGQLGFFDVPMTDELHRAMYGQTAEEAEAAGQLRLLG